MPEQPIPSGREVARIARRLHGVRQKLTSRFGRPRGFDTGALIRFLPVSNSCKTARLNRWLSLREIASTLKMPQYRLRAIEESRLRDVDLRVLESYVACLGLETWYGKWKRANRRLVAGLKETAGRT
jgi:hypothetical protein